MNPEELGRKHIKALAEFDPDFKELIEKTKQSMGEPYSAVAPACKYLSKIYTQRLAAILLMVELRTYRAWQRGTQRPNEYQVRYLQQFKRITDVLKIRLSDFEARNWWITENRYLDGGLPGDWFRHDSDFVHTAALQMLVT